MLADARSGELTEEDPAGSCNGLQAEAVHPFKQDIRRISSCGIRTVKKGTGKGNKETRRVEVLPFSAATFVSLCRESNAPLAVGRGNCRHSNPQ